MENTFRNFTMLYYRIMEEIITALALYALPGMVGGLVRGMVGVSKSILQGKKQIEFPRLLLALLTAVVVGATAAVVAGGDWRIALLAGYAGSDLLESLYKIRLLKLFKPFS